MYSDIVKYLFVAAKDSKYDAKLWLRYLRKVVDMDISEDDLSVLLRSDDLTAYQKLTLNSAVNKCSRLASYLIKLNSPAGTPMVDLIRRDINDRK